MSAVHVITVVKRRHWNYATTNLQCGLLQARLERSVTAKIPKRQN